MNVHIFSSEHIIQNVQWIEYISREFDFNLFWENISLSISSTYLHSTQNSNFQTKKVNELIHFPMQNTMVVTVLFAYFEYELDAY